MLGTIYKVLFLAFVIVKVKGWDHSETILDMAVAALVLWMGALTVFYVREMAVLRRSRRDRALTGDPDGVEEFAVEVVVKVRNEAVGTDRGVLWFDGALLGFSGRHTSFLIAAPDLIAPEGVVLTDWDRPFLPLKPRAGKGKVEVQVRPLFGFARGYRRRMRRFLRANLSSEAPRQRPPLEPYEARGAQTSACTGVPGLSLDDTPTNSAEAVDEPRSQSGQGYGATQASG